MKKAVIAVIQNSHDKYLAVTRKGTTNDWGFPGGLVEEGESYLEAIQRELDEETGYYLFDDQLGGFILMKDGDTEVAVFTIFYSALPNRSPKAEANSLVDWVSKEHLISGTFGQFNARYFCGEIQTKIRIVKEMSNQLHSSVDRNLVMTAIAKPDTEPVEFSYVDPDWKERHAEDCWVGDDVSFAYIKDGAIIVEDRIPERNDRKAYTACSHRRFFDINRLSVLEKQKLLEALLWAKSIETQNN